MTSVISSSFFAYSTHAIGSGLIAGSTCIVADAVADAIESTTNLKTGFSNYLVPALGFCAGMVTAWWIATSPTPQYIAISLNNSVTMVMGGQGMEYETAIQLLKDTIGPQFNSLPSFLCGAAGTALSCWSFSKLGIVVNDPQGLTAV